MAEPAVPEQRRLRMPHNRHNEGNAQGDAHDATRNRHTGSDCSKRHATDNATPPTATGMPLALAEHESAAASRSWRTVLHNAVNYTPPHARFDPSNPPVFTLSLNILFAFAGAFTVANLYYTHPILDVLAREFDVDYETVAQVPTLAQGGYAVGLVLLNPLGDVFRRRRFVLSLVWFTATVWIGLCVTTDFAVFSAISFITGVTTVTPQLMLPLVGDLAPPHRRATALSVVTAGNLLGILIARLLSGIVTQYTSWRNVYWVAFALQYLILVLLWLFMPDYPATDSDNKNYPRMLWSIAVMFTKYPVLVQACLVAICNSAPFTSYWTTLTFLLTDEPYRYSTLVVSLFALIGIAGLVVCPFVARTVIDKYVPLLSVLLGEAVAVVGVVVGTYTGKLSSAGPGFQAFALDIGLQITQIANRSAIYACAPGARNRINTAYMLCTFIGQITGTAAGAALYERGGRGKDGNGWVASGSLSVAFIGTAIVINLARGPWEEGWYGWGGGWSFRKRDPSSADGKTREVAMHTKVVVVDSTHDAKV